MSRNWLSRAALFHLLLHAASASADIYVVNSTLDLPDADPSDAVCATAPPNPVCTLRAAVMQANAHAGPDTIYLPEGTYVLTRVGYDQTAALGDLDITDDVTIEGSGATTVIDANGAVTADRAFEVVSGSLTLHFLTIVNGNTPSYGGAIYAAGNLTLTGVSILNSTAALDGGGIYATGDSVLIDSSVVQGNTTQMDGGGISYVRGGNGSLVLTDAEVAGNQALGGVGGGIRAQDSNIQITNSWLHGNTATDAGGGLSYTNSFSGLSLQIAGSVFDHNLATSGLGGGLYSAAVGATVLSTQFTNNSAQDGGGIFLYGGVNALTNVRVNANTAATVGGGILQEDGSIATGPGTLAIENSSVSDNVAASDGGGIVAYASVSVAASAIYRNHAASGGGVYASAAPVAIDNSIVDSNRAAMDGGGVYADATATVRLDSATITGNTARTSYPSPGSGGGVYIVAGGTLTSSASVLAYNVDSGISFSPNDCSGTMILASYNYLGTNSACTTVIQIGAVGNLIGGTYPNNIDPNLSAFARLYAPAPYPGANASPKYGRVPLFGSPLIDAGPPGGCQAADGSTLLWDEIGQSRTINGRCDIGAVEYGAAVDGIFEDGFGG